MAFAPPARRDLRGVGCCGAFCIGSAHRLLEASSFQGLHHSIWTVPGDVPGESAGLFDEDVFDPAPTRLGRIVQGMPTARPTSLPAGRLVTILIPMQDAEGFGGSLFDPAALDPRQVPIALRMGTSGAAAHAMPASIVVRIPSVEAFMTKRPAAQVRPANAG